MRRTLKTLSLLVSSGLAACGGEDGHTSSSGGEGGAGGGIEGGLHPDAGFELTPCRDLPPSVLRVDFSADGSRLLVGDDRGTSTLDTRTWVVERTVAEHRGHVLGAELSSDGQSAASFGEDEVIRIWDVPSGRRSGVSPKLAGITSFARSADTGVVVAGFADGTVKGLDPASWRELWSVAAGQGPITTLFAAPRGSLFAVGADGGTALRDARDGALLGRSSFGDGVGAFSPDGARLALARWGEEDAVIVVEAKQDMPELGRVRTRAFVPAVALGPDAGSVYVATANGAERLALPDGAVEMAYPSRVTPERLTVSSDGSRIAIASQSLHVYDAGTGEVVHEQEPNGFAWLHDVDRTRPYVAWAGPGQAAEVWDYVAGVRLRVFPDLRGNGIVAFHPSGELLIDRDGVGRYYDLATSDPTRVVTYEMAGDPVQDSSFSPEHSGHFTMSPDGTLLLGSEDARTRAVFRVFDAATGELDSTFPGFEGGQLSWVWSPDGKLIAVSGYDASDDSGVVTTYTGIAVRIHDAETKELLHELVGHEHPVPKLAFFPDSQRLLTADERGSIRIWNAETGEPIEELLEAHAAGADEGDVHDANVAISPDGRYLASAAVNWDISPGHTGVITIFDVETREPVRRLYSYADANFGEMSFSPDARHLLAGRGPGMRVYCLGDSPAVSSPPPPPAR